MALTHLHCMLDIALSLCAPCVSAHKSEGTLRGLCCKLCLQCSNCRAAQVHKLHKLHTHPQTSADCWHAHCTFGQRTSAYGIGDAGCHCLPCRRTETADVKGVQSKLPCMQTCMLVSARTQIMYAWFGQRRICNTPRSFSSMHA